VRVLFDTNVLFAAFTATGLCFEVVEEGTAQCQVVTSRELLAELSGALKRKFKLGPATREAIAEFRELCEIVKAGPLPTRVCRDADDDRVLAAAIAGKVDVIVTGDDDLLVLRRHEGIRILSPREFLWRLEDDGLPRAR
jgi:putative PIN family toxin of toxin-antitoxin system